MKQAHRFSGPGGAYEGLTELGPSGPRWTGKIRLVEELLEQPLRWKKPRKIFVNSMSDLFHEDVPFEFIDKVFAVMALCPQHTFQVLTKRPERMRQYLNSPDVYRRVLRAADQEIRPRFPKTGSIGISDPAKFPARWIWLGVSVEDQKAADQRIPILLQTSAAVRFVSYEPALETVDLKLDCIDIAPGYKDGFLHRSDMPHPCDYSCGGIKIAGGLDWVIAGGESGPHARPFNIQWARDIVAQCKAAGVACFVKQLGAYVQWDGIQGGYGDGPSNVWPENTVGFPDGSLFRRYLADRKGGDIAEWPEDLRVREFPGAVGTGK